MPRGLIVTNGVTPENFLGMPEAIGMLMLVLLHRLHESERLLRENAGRPQQIFARMVRGRAIGLIDSGRIEPGDRATVGVRSGTDTGARSLPDTGHRTYGRGAGETR